MKGHCSSVFARTRASCLLSSLLVLAAAGCAVDTVGFPVLGRATCARGVNVIEVWSLGGHVRARHAFGFSFGYNALAYLFPSEGCPKGKCSVEGLERTGACYLYGDGTQYFWKPWSPVRFPKDYAATKDVDESQPMLIDVRNGGIGLRMASPLPGVSLGYEATTVLADVPPGASVDRVVEYQRGAPEKARITLCKGEARC